MTGSGETSTKSARTRARLMVAGFELFADQGYERTTVAQIAKAAGVSEMTFYRHFGSKDQLLIDDPYDPLIVQAIGEQPTDLPPLIRTVRGIRLAWRRLPIDNDDPVRDRVAIVSATPSLLPVMRASTSATEAAIAEQLVVDGSDATAAAVAAAAAMAALMTGLMRWAADNDGGALGTAIERSLKVLEPGDD